jgi:hypothetical protein
MGNFSDYGEALTDDYPSKKRTDKLEAEIKKIKTTCNLDPAFFGLIVVVSGAIS